MRRRPMRRRGALPPLLDMTPMVDVVFLLIIFFMVSTTFISFESGLPVDLPQARSSVQQTSEQPTVTIDRDGAVYLGGAGVAEEELIDALRAELESRGTGVVVLRADRDVVHGQTVRVMDLIKQAGAQRIAIATGG